MALFGGAPWAVASSNVAFDDEPNERLQELQGCSGRRVAVSRIEFTRSAGGKLLRRRPSVVDAAVSMNQRR